METQHPIITILVLHSITISITSISTNYYSCSLSPGKADSISCALHCDKKSNLIKSNIISLF